MKKMIVVALLALSIKCAAQSNEILFSRKYEAYRSAHPLTKMHLVFNQRRYAPGDTVWFKVYFLNQDLLPINGTQLIDLNLIDSRGVSSEHFHFNVTNGAGQNQLVIDGCVFNFLAGGV